MASGHPQPIESSSDVIVEVGEVSNLDQVEPSTEPAAQLQFVDHLDQLPHEMFINRELSWLQFNDRVLFEAEEIPNPLLERTKFVAIHSSNLEEFFMIRVAGVKRKLTASIVEPGPDGRTPAAVFAAVRAETSRQLNVATNLFTRSLTPALKRKGITITNCHSLSASQKQEIKVRFQEQIFPVLTPQGVDRARRFPHISNESVNLIVILDSPSAGRRYARVKVPAVLPRLVRLTPSRPSREHPDSRVMFVWLEDVVAYHIQDLFPGNDVIATYPFHVTRDADIEVDEDDEDEADLLHLMRELLSERTFGAVVKLTVTAAMPGDVRLWLTEQLGASGSDLYVVDGPLALGDLWELMRLDRPDLKDPAFTPAPVALPPGNSLPGIGSALPSADPFTFLRSKDVLVHHPYQSFSSVADFLRVAATDPDVVAIKQTLYRIGRDSPLIPALIEARDDDTQVAVLVELKARFDEESNISWAQQLEHYGVHVAYGVAGLKTHCKLTLVVRREDDGLRRYAHLATGNYNATTARVYEDLGLFTADEEIAADVSELFNALTGYAQQQHYRKLWVAPIGMRRQILSAIGNEISLHQQHGGGRLIFKMNALVDRQIIRGLYLASQAGLEIDLIVRGACCIRPGVQGWSESIRVRSVIGRFLEHSRIYLFGNGGKPRVMLGSADLMERNLDRRVEVLFPVEDEQLLDHIQTNVLPAYFRDNVNSWVLNSSEQYCKLNPDSDDERFDLQQHFLDFYADVATSTDMSAAALPIDR